MRSNTPSVLALVLGVASVAACGSDPLLGTWSVTVTGANTMTSPIGGTSPETGTGSVAITTGSTTASQMADYAVTLAVNNLGGCVFNANISSGGATFPTGQTCITDVNGNTTTVTLTSGSMAALQSGTLTLTLSYSYAGTTDTLDAGFSGTGMMTFTGMKR